VLVLEEGGLVELVIILVLAHKHLVVTEGIITMV
jgi:hypothetical protein